MSRAKPAFGCALVKWTSLRSKWASIGLSVAFQWAPSGFPVASKWLPTGLQVADFGSQGQLLVPRVALFAWEGSRNKYLTYFAILCKPPKARIRVLRDLGLQAVRAILHELPKVLGLLDALGTLLLDCRCILEPSKAFAGLPSEAFEGLWRPSKAFGDLRRPFQVFEGLPSEAFAGLWRPVEAFQSL